MSHMPATEAAEVEGWLQNTAPFAGLPQEARDGLREVATVHDFAPGEAVMEKGDARDAIWGVMAGEIRLFDGHACLHDSGCCPGDVFGVLGALEQQPLPYYTVAALPSRLLRIPTASFGALCTEHADFGEAFQTLPLEVPNLEPIGGWVGGGNASPYAMINQIEANWGRVLDAGTGDGSLAWLLSAPSKSLTAVTMDEEWAEQMRHKFADDLRPDDRVLVGDWQDPSLLQGEVFDVVVADYLVGALERYHPGFQYDFFQRLRPHVGTKLYIIGLEPLPESTSTVGEGVLKDAHKLRDISIMLADEHPYREYPASWLIKSLEQAQFNVEGYQLFPKLYGARAVHGILSETLHRHVARFREPHMAAAMAQSMAHVRKRADAATDLAWGRRFGQDHLIVATPC